MPQGSSQVETRWVAEHPRQPWRFLSQAGHMLVTRDPFGRNEPPAPNNYTSNVADAAKYRDAGSVPARAGKAVRFTITYQREET